jgi:hypothetical protein
MRRRVEAVCRRFPTETAVFSRPVLDAYNQPTDENTSLGSVECWRIPGARPDQWAVAQAGQTYADDDALWVTVIWRADLPQWKHGDVCMLPDGVKRTVRNIQNRGDVRVFLQLAEV